MEISHQALSDENLLTVIIVKEKELLKKRIDIMTRSKRRDLHGD